MSIVRDDKPARTLAQGWKLHGTGVARWNRAYRDERKDEVLRMMRA
jgi:hypothetical protein